MATTAVGAGSQRGEVEPHRVAPVQARRSGARGERRQSPAPGRGRARPRGGGRRRRPAARSAPPPRPRPRAPRRSGPSSASRTIASSRFGSARKFCPSLTDVATSRRAPGVRLDRPLELARRRRRAPRRPTSARGDDVGRLVRLAAHRLRRQEGRVGLDQQQLVGHLAPPPRAARRRFGIGDVAGEGAVPAALDRLARPARGPRSSAGSP